MTKSNLNTLVSMEEIGADIAEILTETDSQLGTLKAIPYAVRMGKIIKENLLKYPNGAALLQSLNRALAE